MGRRAMEILQVESPPREHCGHVAADVEPPLELVEPRSEKRLVAPLREAARTRDAAEILVRATLLAAEGDPRAQRLARAMSDMAVTGAHAAATLGAHLDARDLAERAGARIGPGDREVLGRAAEQALSRARLVARWLELSAEGRARLARDRPELDGWIGVSGEDDPPHRPVNVPFAAHLERSVRVEVRGHALRVRYAMAGAIGAPMVLLLHGHCSRHEEYERLAAALADARDARGAPSTACWCRICRARATARGSITRPSRRRRPRGRRCSPSTRTSWRPSCARWRRRWACRPSWPAWGAGASAGTSSFAWRSVARRGSSASRRGARPRCGARSPAT
ncbi:MAG: hypothetical protein M5U28_08475 [Sandaracinaceae bacterium]|nr:hypothetical protein [Sandaracinaceae bacterium]